MVGVAGGSKGCRTCKRRRKGCDLRYPTCRQCEKAGFICMGYDNATQFVVYNTTQKSLQPAKPKNEQKIDPVSQLLESLQCGALKTLYFDHAWASLCQPSGEGEVSFGWIPSFAAAQPDNKAVSLAYTAVALARNGQRMQCHDMVRQSFTAYTKAISRLGRLVQDRKAMVADETLATSLLLALYETLQGSPNRVSAWVSHIRGSVELIRLRGPAAHVPSTGHALLQDLRLHAVLDSIIRRKHSFLSTAPWLQKPWENTSKSPKDCLIDLMSNIPGILEEADRLRHRLDLPASLPDLYAMRNTYASLTTEIKRWRRSLDNQERPTPYYYKPATSFSDPAEHHLMDMYPSVLHFVDLERAELEVLYWTTQLVLHGNFFYMYQEACRSPISKHEIPRGFPRLGSQDNIPLFEDLFDPLETMRNNWRHADHIAESLEYFLHPDRGALAMNFIIFPIVVAMSFMKLFEDSKVPFFQSMLGKFEERIRIPLGAFIYSAYQRDDVKLVK